MVLQRQYVSMHFDVRHEILHAAAYYYIFWVQFVHGEHSPVSVLMFLIVQEIILISMAAICTVPLDIADLEKGLF